MIFTFDKNTLVKEITTAQEIVSTKNALSILSNILLTAKDGKLFIRATDTKIELKTSVPVEIEEEGEATVLCDKFASVLKSLPDGDAKFELMESDHMTVAKVASVAKRVKYQLNCTAKDKFPEEMKNEDLTFINVPSKDFKRMILQTAYAVSTDVTRYFMSGVYVEGKENMLVMTATDGRRLSHTEKDILLPRTEFKSAIVPPKILSVVSKHASNEGNIAFAVTDRLIFFKFGNYELSSSLVDGEYPNYRHVIPEKQSFKAVLPLNELVSAIKRISVMTDKNGKIYFEIKNGSMSVSSSSADYGKASEEIPCEYEGADIMIALRCQHVIESLDVSGSEKIVFEFTDTLKACTLHALNDDKYFNVVMPMSL